MSDDHAKLLPPRRMIAVLGAAAMAGLLTAALATRPDGRLHVTVLDTGGGTAMVLRTPGGATALVGGGSDPQKLTTALGRTLSPLQRNIDVVVIPGSGRTVSAGVAGLAGRYGAGSIVVTAPTVTPALGVLVTQIGEGASAMRVTTGALDLVNARWFPLIPSSGAGSALLVVTGSARILLAADLSVPDQEEIAAIAPVSLHADLLITPATGTAPALVAAVQPRQIAVTTAVRSRDRTAWPGATVRRTGSDGDLAYRSTDAGLEPG